MFNPFRRKRRWPGTGDAMFVAPRLDRYVGLWEMYAAQYNRSGALPDLEQALQACKKIVCDVPRDEPEWARWMSNLGVVYRRRYRQTGVLADLDLGVELGERAVAAVANDDPLAAELWAHLGDGYADLFLCTGRSADLLRAIDLYERVVAALPEGSLEWAEEASYLAGLYGKRLSRGEIADAPRAVELGERALAATPLDHPKLASRVSSLSIVHLDLYICTEDPRDVQRAIELGEQALSVTPREDPQRAARLANVALAYRGRFETDGLGVDGRRLHEFARQVAEATAAAPIDQVRARHEVGSLAHATDEHRLAATLVDGAVAALHAAAPWEAGWTDQEHQLTRFPDLVSVGIAAHCALGDPAGAVEIAERGRGLVLANQVDLRTDLVGLDPELALRFRELQAELAPGRSAIVDARRTEVRRQLRGEYEALVTRIRQQPDFSDFLMPAALPELSSAAADGVVVLVNVGLWRSDAIIITAAGDPILLPLTGLKHDDVYSRLADLLDATRDTSWLVGALKKQRALPDVLGWLWDTVVEPVLAAIRSAGPVTEPAPRLWWMPTGVLGLFPLHAAGHPGQPGALDAVVSSYTPTLRALVRARNRPKATVRRQLTVALSHTPGAADLPGTTVEESSLEAGWTDIVSLTDHEATADRVLAALPAATWTHFACHAVADLGSPSRGGIRLHDGMLLPAIGQLDLPRAELAYLSACSTASSGLRHVNETLHLASSFQLAGYRHVVASLWPLTDQVAASAARSFYDAMGKTVTADHAATALHRVTHDLRAEYPNRPDLWSPLIHSGP